MRDGREPTSEEELIRTGLRGERLAENITHFVRVLRRAGMHVGPATLLQSIDAAGEIDLGAQRQFYHALESCIVKRPEDRLLFDQLFHSFWRNPNFMDKMREMITPTLGTESAPEPVDDPLLRRADDAMQPDRPNDPAPERDEEEERIEIDSALAWSAEEKLQTMDFQMMSAEEIAEAERAIDRLVLPVPQRPSRRFLADRGSGRLSFRHTLRQMSRRGGLALPVTEKQLFKPRPVVVICDISGSMERYSRMLLRFTHALTQRRGRVHSFLFGTRLTNISHEMRDRDPDAAMRSIAKYVKDWSGGTRITGAIAEFNHDWSRRVLGQGAVVLLITDGLDRDPDGSLEAEIERLHKSCHRLIWLNPLLRFDGFEPRSQGVQKILPHVDAFIPVHSLDSIDQLADVLSKDIGSGWRDRSLAGWVARLHHIRDEDSQNENRQDEGRQDEGRHEVGARRDEAGADGTASGLTGRVI